MDLYVIRHAEAYPIGEAGAETDEARPLTPAGEEQARRTAAALKRRGIAFDHLISSPLVRARQTAEIISSVMTEGAQSIEISEGLVPGAKPKKLAKDLLKLEGDRFAIVGHMPHLADWIAWVIGDKEAKIEMAKSGVALVECSDAPQKGSGSLVWLTTPIWFD
jgi:phosphohistidine phosphatase